jgi:thiosulfate dehydrogenase [quinone] large subunit
MVILAFLESFKYLGHQWPLSMLRIFIGYIFLQAGFNKVNMHFLTEPILQETIYKWINQGIENQTFLHFLQTIVLPHWQIFSYLVTIGEMAVGLSYIFGFLVRPAALGGLLMNATFVLAAGINTQLLNQVLMGIHVIFFLAGAGRSIGFDYYFYKKVRGLWW